MARILQMHDPIDWVPMDSSVLQAVAYVSRRKWLYLKFHSGEIYRYFDFPPHQYQDFLAAESKGIYFSKQIRDRFQYDRLSQAFRAGR